MPLTVETSVGPVLVDQTSIGLIAFERRIGNPAAVAFHTFREFRVAHGVRSFEQQP